MGEDSEEVASITGAHADHVDGTRGAPVESRAEKVLNNDETARQLGTALVPLVPRDPFAHDASMDKVRVSRVKSQPKPMSSINRRSATHQPKM